jgi:hypothetical protein
MRAYSVLLPKDFNILARRMVDIALVHNNL